MNRAPPSNRALIRRRVFIAHAAVTAAAGIVLIARPAAIPATVGIHLTRDAYLLSYLLAAAEVAFAVLSWLAARLSDASAVRAIIAACVVLHAVSGVLEAVVWLSHPTIILLANIAARLAIITAFLWLFPSANEIGRVPTLPYNER